MHHDFVIDCPDDIPLGWEVSQIVRCSHGPLVRWAPPECDEDGDCLECEGGGFLTARGRTTNFEVDCPECDGSGVIGGGVPAENFPAADALWSTAFGEMIEPELTPDGELSHQWLMQWIYSQDRVAA